MRPPRRLTIVFLFACLAVVAVALATSKHRILYRIERTYYPSGTLKEESEYSRWWDREHYLRTTIWHENGRPYFRDELGVVRQWDDGGRLVAGHSRRSGSGVVASLAHDGIHSQSVYLSHNLIDVVTAPPWLTEEQIERALNGIWP